ncbi:MAG: PRD domain-containing protein [Lachnospiraceae bacterium]|nr:PRD domain-containing protein [Lachnospiraceae bacterium]
MKEVLKARQAEILKCMITASTPLDLDYFKERFEKQERTIRYDIGNLKELCGCHGVEIRYQTKKGYYVPATQKTAASKLLVQCEVVAKEGLGDSSEDERFEQLFLYLFVRTDYVTAEKMASAYYISRSTLSRFLGKLESWFDHVFSLDARKALGYRLKGDEIGLRSLAARILAGRFRGSYTAEDWFMLLPAELKSKISLQDVAEISQSIRKLNGRYNIWISNASYLNLLCYCMVCKLRLRMGCIVWGEPLKRGASGTYDEELLMELSATGEGGTSGELKGLSLVLRENGICSQEGFVEEARLDGTIHKVLAYIEEAVGSDSFHLDTLYQDLFDHLKNFLNLSAHGEVEEENSYVLEEVREHYYSYYQLAVKCGEIIQREMELPYHELEICYLAVYLYKNSIQAEKTGKNVLVVCATGKGLSHLLTLRIKNVFPMLNVVGQISPWQLSRVSDLKDVDFVISTIPLEHKLVPVIKISRILSEEDIKRIQDYLKYGNLVDEIPMSQKNEASFSAKEDPFLLREKTLTEDQGLVEAASILSRLILTLLEYTSKFPEKYRMSRDAMLGMVIHMSMAVPRWFEGSSQTEASEEFGREYHRIRKSDPDVFALMEKFFDLVEKTLRVRISISERVAFFLYITEEV